MNRAVLLEPSSTGPYILLGETFLKLKQPIQALHYLDHAEKMDPSNYITHNLLGQAYKATGQMAAANREFHLTVEIAASQRSQARGEVDDAPAPGSARKLLGFARARARAGIGTANRSGQPQEGRRCFSRRLRRPAERQFGVSRARNLPKP